MSNRLSEWLDRLAATRFAESLGELALSYLAWRPRIERAERDMRSFPERPAGSATKHKLSRRDSTFASASALRESFVAAFLAEHRDWTKEDADAAVDQAFAHCAALIDWMEVLTRAFGVRLAFDRDEPQVAIATSAGWHALTNRFDPDAVACFLLARAGHVGELERLVNWGVATRVSDRDLSVVLDEGITDLHLHLGGARNAQILWRNLLTGEIATGRIARYSLQSVDALASLDAGEHAARIGECDRIECLVRTVADVRSPLGCRWADVPDPERLPAGENERRIAEASRRERAMMGRAWRDLLDRSEETRDAALHAELTLEHELDRYLFAKNLFLAKHRQPTQGNPGLGVFRQYYRSVEPIWPQGRLAPARYERSRRLQIREYAEYAAAIAQSRSLKRVELRLGPLGRPRDYHQFFRAWMEAETEFALARRGVDIRFAIHFKRSLTARGRGKGAEADAAPLRKFLRELDRDSAALHAYRSGEEWAEHSWRIARVDFAGSERDIPPDAASFCMNLVRGDQAALDALGHGACDGELHRFWVLHAERGTARPPRGRPSLGVTCHAGEDYAHPLEGIFCIASAAHLLRMRPGDTIGHGLALGHDCASYERARGATSLTVRGLQFDALLWLYGRCHERTGDPALSLLEPWLRQEAYELYGPPARRVQSLRTLERLLLVERGRPIAPRHARPPEPCARLRHMEIWDDRCGARRAERVPLADIIFRLTPAIEAAQTAVLAHLAESGIALEFNPSSNLRVSGSLAPRDIPFMRILAGGRGNVLATINTDDPGTFGTRIENEYALVMRALIEADFTRADALEVVRRLRDVGRHLVYWPRRPVEDAAPDGGAGRDSGRV